MPSHNATASCRATHVGPSAQTSFVGYVMTTNPSSVRTQRTVALLASLNISTRLFAAVHATSNSEPDKVRSNLMTQRAIYDTVARQHSEPKDEYVLIFEDDVMVAPGIPSQIVRRLLACGAHLSLKHSLPMFYAGSCGPIGARNASLDPAAGVYALRDPHIAVRVSGRCAHAYAVRRRNAPMLRDLADRQPNRGHERFHQSYYMDVQLDHLAQQHTAFISSPPR